MFHKWLDRWDERRAHDSDELKKVSGLEFRADLAFSLSEDVTTISEFGPLAEMACAESHTFYDVDGEPLSVSWNDGWISFPSNISTETPENNTVWAKVTETNSSDHAVIIFHHWNATSRNPVLARFLAWQGLSVYEIAMPYHLERRRFGSSHADYMLGPNLGRTIQSMRQAVIDGRQLAAILKRRGYSQISVLGISLGSWVAGLIAAHEPKVTKAALLLPGGSLADMIWTGEATRHIRESLDEQIGLRELRTAWAPLSLECYVSKLSRSDLGIQIIMAERDKVVLPALTASLATKLENVGARYSVSKINCGHYSLSLPPYAFMAGKQAARFLN